MSRAPPKVSKLIAAHVCLTLKTQSCRLRMGAQCQPALKVSVGVVWATMVCCRRPQTREGTWLEASSEAGGLKNCFSSIKRNKLTFT